MKPLRCGFARVLSFLPVPGCVHPRPALVLPLLCRTTTAVVRMALRLYGARVQQLCVAGRFDGRRGGPVPILTPVWSNSPVDHACEVERVRAPSTKPGLDAHVLRALYNMRRLHTELLVPQKSGCHCGVTRRGRRHAQSGHAVAPSCVSQPKRNSAGALHLNHWWRQWFNTCYKPT